jgi:hypothetical protein
MAQRFFRKIGQGAQRFFGKVASDAPKILSKISNTAGDVGTVLRRLKILGATYSQIRWSKQVQEWS